eukprot:6942520-Prymnesium_polylepis.2
MDTSSVTLPAACASMVHSSCVLEMYRAPTGTAVPSRHVSPGPGAKLAPVTRTTEPPSCGPITGCKLSTTAHSAYSNSTRSSVKSCKLLVTSIVYTPCCIGGATHMISAYDTHTASNAASSPKRQVLPGTKPTPTTLVLVPP